MEMLASFRELILERVGKHPVHWRENVSPDFRVLLCESKLLNVTMTLYFNMVDVGY